MNKNKSKIIFFIAALLWGSSYAVQKPLLESVDPVTFTFWNFFLTGLLFLVYALYNKIPLTYRIREGVVLGVFLAGIEIFEMVGLKMTSSANTVFLTNIGMLMIPYAGYLLFKRKIKIEDNLAIVVATVGMYLLVGGVHGFNLGDGIVLFSSLASALYFIYSERYEAERSSHITSLCVQQFFTIAAICLVWNIFAGVSLAVPSGFKVALLWQTVLFTTLPYTMIQWASRYADEMVAAIYDGVVEPLTGAIVAWVVFSEATSFPKVLGGMIMVLSFVLAAIASKRHFIYMKLKDAVQKGKEEIESL